MATKKHNETKLISYQSNTFSLSKEDRTLREIFTYFIKTEKKKKKIKKVITKYRTKHNVRQI